MGFVADAQLSGGAGPGAWAAICATLSNLAVLVVAVRMNDLKATRLDWFSLAVCALAGIGWAITDQPLVGVVMISLLEVFAILPTMRKSWHRPHEETASICNIGGNLSALAFRAR